MRGDGILIIIKLTAFNSWLKNFCGHSVLRTHWTASFALKTTFCCVLSMSNIFNWWHDIVNACQQCDDTIELAQCRFHGTAISSAKMLIHFSNKIYRRTFIKKHSETVMVWNYQLQFKKNLLCHLLQFSTHFCPHYTILSRLVFRESLNKMSTQVLYFQINLVSPSYFRMCSKNWRCHNTSQ